MYSCYQLGALVSLTQSRSSGIGQFVYRCQDLSLVWFQVSPERRACQLQYSRAPRTSGLPHGRTSPVYMKTTGKTRSLRGYRIGDGRQAEHVCRFAVPAQPHSPHRRVLQVPPWVKSPHLSSPRSCHLLDQFHQAGGHKVSYPCDDRSGCARLALTRSCRSRPA